MTGTDHHIAGLGNLIEWTNISGQNDPNGKMSTAPQRGMPGYEGYLNERVATGMPIIHRVFPQATRTPKILPLVAISLLRWVDG